MDSDSSPRGNGKGSLTGFAPLCLLPCMSEAHLSRPESISKQFMRLGANFCPGILHAVPAKDGLLMRIRVPGGLIDAKQLKTIALVAEASTDGSIEITSRANLQLRAIQESNLKRIIDQIASVGLLPSPQHDRVRNIVASPLTGLDVEEVIDCRPLIRELDRRLTAEDVFTELHPKFSFGIYGLSKRFGHETDDISLEAIDFIGEPRFRLLIGGVASGFAVAHDHAVDCLLASAKVCLDVAKQFGSAVRGKKLLAIEGTMQRILDRLSHLLMPCPREAKPAARIEMPLGIYPSIQSDRVNIIPSVALGRMTGVQARYLANVAEDVDLRLAPWRGIVLGSIPAAKADEIVAKLHSIGLPCDRRDGYHGIAACAGIIGCDASLADVRSDASALARILAGSSKFSGWTVNISGCEKQCARRHGAAADMIADASGYTLRVKGHPVASNCSSEFAINAVAALHTEMLSEAVSQ